MRNRSDRRISWCRVAALSLIAAVLAAGGSGCSKQTDGLPYRVVRGPLTVRYEIARSDTESSRTTGDGVGASEIRLFNEYVIIVSEDGKHGSLYPIARIKSLGWTKQ